MYNVFKQTAQFILNSLCYRVFVTYFAMLSIGDPLLIIDNNLSVTRRHAREFQLLVSLLVYKNFTSSVSSV